MRAVRTLHNDSLLASASPSLSSSPSQLRKHDSTISPSPSSLTKRQIACPLPLKAKAAFPLKTTSSQHEVVPTTTDVLDSSQMEWEEKNVLFAVDIYNTNMRESQDGESLINLVEAEWELEQIFRAAPAPAANTPRFAWMMNDEDSGLFDEDTQLDSSWIAEDDLPRLGFSPQAELVEQLSLPETLHAPPQLYVIPPSRARNPVPLNTPFQASTASGLLMTDHGSQLGGPATADPFYESERMEECGSLSGNTSSPSLGPLSPATSPLGGHMRKRNRSYSDSMLKRDSMSDVTNSLVLVS